MTQNMDIDTGLTKKGLDEVERIVERCSIKYTEMLRREIECIKENISVRLDSIKETGELIKKVIDKDQDRDLSLKQYLKIGAVASFLTGGVLRGPGDIKALWAWVLGI